MENHKLSKLQFYSIGIVAANKVLSSDIIEVIAIEEFPMLDGELSDNIDKYKTELKNAQDEPYKVEIKTTASIKAKWVPINNSNRKTSPDVRRGEYVVIYRFADTDSYWWNTLKNDNTLRRLETVIYTFNNMQNENVADGPDTTYWFEVSTHKKLMHIHTSKNDGEPFTYDIQIDTKNGKIVITDDVNNFITINSKDTIIRIENNSGSFIELIKDIININANTEINLVTPTFNISSSDSVNIATPFVNVSDDLIVGCDIVNGGVVASGDEHIAAGYELG